MRKGKKKKEKVKGGIEDSFIDLMELHDPTIVSLYGRGGTGKTTVAASFPKPLLLIDVKDKGGESAKTQKLKKGDIIVAQIRTFDEILDIFEYVRDNPDLYATVVIDHMTILQDLALEKVKGDEGKEHASQRIFGLAATYMKDVISQHKDLSDLGIIPVFICQDRLESGEGEGEDQLIPEVGFGLMPSVAKVLGAASRVIGHCYLYENTVKKKNMSVKRTIEYRLRLGPNPYYITKVTRPKGTPCPMYLVDPSYSDIEKIIAGEWGDEEKKVKKKRRLQR